MANSFADDPFILDTATASAAGVLATGVFIDVYAFRWTSGSLADAISITDAAGNVKWSSTGTVANNVDQTIFDANRPMRMNGLTVATIGSGKVYVYAKRTR